LKYNEKILIIQVGGNKNVCSIRTILKLLSQIKCDNFQLADLPFSFLKTIRSHIPNLHKNYNLLNVEKVRQNKIFFSCRRKLINVKKKVKILQNNNFGTFSVLTTMKMNKKCGPNSEKKQIRKLNAIITLATTY